MTMWKHLPRPSCEEEEPSFKMLIDNINCDINLNHP